MRRGDKARPRAMCGRWATSRSTTLTVRSASTLRSTSILSASRVDSSPISSSFGVCPLAVWSNSNRLPPRDLATQRAGTRPRPSIPLRQLQSRVPAAPAAASGLSPSTASAHATPRNGVIALRGKRSCCVGHRSVFRLGRPRGAASDWAAMIRSRRSRPASGGSPRAEFAQLQSRALAGGTGQVAARYRTCWTALRRKKREGPGVWASRPEAVWGWDGRPDSGQAGLMLPRRRRHRRGRGQRGLTRRGGRRARRWSGGAGRGRRCRGAGRRGGGRA